MEAQTKSSSSSKKSNEDDWVCVDTACANVNFAWRTSCNLCKKERAPGQGGGGGGAGSASKKKLGHEIGKAIAEKSRGLFSPDDWQCNKCGNVNWARRSQCNMCNAPKFGEVEERTGLGGGYNERGVVEYVRREESDDEYDEFGRRKKRNPGSSIHSEDSYQGGLGGNKADVSEHDEDGKEEEDEEDDDDDDDGDLSKYDLSGWGEEEETSGSKDASSNHRNNRSRSRSRSRSPLRRKQ